MIGKQMVAAFSGDIPDKAMAEGYVHTADGF
jgi:hypothetical protein